MTPETKTKRDIVAYLNTLEECWHVAYHTMGYGKRGVMDRLACYRGCFVGMEIKIPGKDATPWQARCIEEVIAAGGVAGVVRSVDDAKALIAEVDRRLDNPFAKVSNRRLFGL